MKAWLAAAMAWLMQTLRRWLPSILGSAAAAGGVGLVTHQLAIPALTALIQAKVSALPPLVYAYFYACGFDVVVSILLSAMAARMAREVALRRVQVVQA